MKYEKLDKVKNLYDKGFRCIRYEEGQDGELIVYFKNFEDEMIDSVIAEDKNEANKIKEFIDKY